MSDIPHAPALHVECPHCHQQHHRCLGHYSRADGPHPCGRVVGDGGDKCYRHGGESSSPARRRARKAGIKDRSKAMSEVLATLNHLGVPVETDALSALESQLKESAGIVAIFREHLQLLRIPDVTDPTQAAGGHDALWHPSIGGLSPHILLKLYNEERERFANLAAMALRAGLAERQVRVLEQQASLVADLLRRVLDDPDLGLSAEQRQRGRQIAAGHLRLVGSS